MKFNVTTLGCKVNSYESTYIKESLESNGFSLCNEKDSDIIILNTCTVTNTSDKKCLKTLRHLKKENNHAIFVVCGCSSQNNYESYLPYSDIIIGNKGKSKLIEYLNLYMENKKQIIDVDNNRALPFENMKINDFEHVRCYIKIQDGCDNFCAYCIIPFVRGSIRSKDFDLIIHEVKCIAKRGFKEIVLTGIHTGSYNFSGKDLSDLLHELAKIDGIDRIRISSIEITELNDKFLEELKNNHKICNHMHIPLQAGSDDILKLMNRKYDLAYFFDKIKKIRSIREDISITTDVIVGFPLESDKNFLDTLKNCEALNFSKIHVFPYSRREGTKASRMDGEISPDIKKQRAHELIELSNKLEQDYYNLHIGKNVRVLIEEEKDGFSYGHTSNYLYVKIPGSYERNTYVDWTINE